MRKNDSKVSDKSRKGTDKRLPRSKSRQIEDVDGPNNKKLAAPSASNLVKTATDFMLNTNSANMTIGEAAGVSTRGNVSNIFPALDKADREKL